MNGVFQCKYSSIIFAIILLFRAFIQFRSEIFKMKDCLLLRLDYLILIHLIY